ncbi:MAG: NADH-quinone oxidoreductase subunit M [Deinococcus sp.]|nr:NADH-quinone oxidoreductase subunit M [Deinococcus sp.]
MSGFPYLTVLIFLPLVGSVLALLSRQGQAARTIALVTSLLTLGLGLLVAGQFQSSQAGFQLQERFQPWAAEGLGASYHLGIDGISLLLILLTTVLSAVSVIASWHIERQPALYFGLLLILETGMLGTFASLDLVLFYIFFETTLVPMYFLIGLWGYENRVYAAYKFFLYTMSGSVLMMLAILGLYFVGGHTFDLPALLQAGVPAGAQYWLFLGFAIAFAIKVPLFPLHTWLPDAHTEAPTAGSVLLDGILLKLGNFGFVRFCLPLFPDASRAFAPLVMTLAVIGILYGAMVAVAQKDLKRLVAYSSVAHLGFVMLGLFAGTSQGISGAVLQMVNHGLSTGALFLLVGMLADRRHTRQLAAFGGLWRQMPVFGALFIITALASAGLPGLNGFVGEFLILQGSFLANETLAALGTAGVILAAVYLLHAVGQVLHGKLTAQNAQLSDAKSWELFALVPLVLLMLWIGLRPNTFLRPLDQAVAQVVSRLELVTAQETR